MPLGGGGQLGLVDQVIPLDLAVAVDLVEVGVHYARGRDVDAVAGGGVSGDQVGPDRVGIEGLDELPVHTPKVQALPDP